MLNPLWLGKKPTQATITLRTEQLVTAINEIVGDAKLSVFMKALLTPCLSTLLRKGDASLVDLVTFMDDEKNGALIESGMANPILSHRIFFQS